MNGWMDEWILLTARCEDSGSGRSGLNWLELYTGWLYSVHKKKSEPEYINIILKKVRLIVFGPMFFLRLPTLLITEIGRNILFQLTLHISIVPTHGGHYLQINL